MPELGDFGSGVSFGGTIAPRISASVLSYLIGQNGRRYRFPTVRENCDLNQVFSLEVTPMRGETKERWRELCERAMVEQDPHRFVATIQELLQVLEEKEERQRNRKTLGVPLGKRPATSSCPVA